MKIVEPTASLLWATPDALQTIERAGRTCYKSEDKITNESAKEFVRLLIKRGHEAMIEHASASFRFICDRGVSHEIVRHRICAFAQESTRYCNYGKEKFGQEITVIEPPGLTGCQRDIWAKTMVDCEAAYLDMLKGGVQPQIARSVLPNSLKTEIVVTANFREWRHILNLRTSQAAHPQIRQVMRPVYFWFSDHYSVIVEDIKPYTEPRKPDVA